ncbi:MAG TPA: O-acetyl-ADP-ribose deacetylase [Acidobacteriota bacterium]|nr:O-acetyl-ADP-ribose deacetylase [Acidobacteriota bacterium]HNR38960.1 O-acetyl-ADP-ribose deacetylase [Acidobacteriota bacterium]HNU00885.1 O-acetyl-ADP-ribose deacetylase [Acidobacteriota bacterium]HPB27539.1 O-acetyl-ADP-ribose deacetylase [Acidobacteriota bacterium]HQO24619.1 O-acetyl-ADP-ribose deacetylase [Acidobacteriota bacterium]
MTPAKASRRIRDCVLELSQGDITRTAADAIVNAANSTLMGGGGVDGAIHQAGGPAILDDCRRIIARIGSLPTGRAVATTGGRLPARRVLHTVGPVWRGGGAGEPELLAACYRTCLQLAADEELDTVAFPSISTGAFGYPVAAAAAIALRTVAECLRAGGHPRCVRFVLFDRATYDAYRIALDGLPDDPSDPA